MAKLIINANGQAGRVIELKTGVNHFGRGSTNDHVFAEDGVSDRHCAILVEKDQVFVRDLNSTNGISIDGDPVHESALYPGQTLRMGVVEMVLDGPAPVRIALPELPPPEPVEPPPPAILPDGYPSCPNHYTRHAIWECPHCQRVYCDECIRKLRRVGGEHLHLCAACSNPCRYTAWSELMRKKKKSFFGRILSKINEGIKRTTRQINR